MNFHVIKFFYGTYSTAAEFATPSFSGRSHLEVRRIEKATQELSIEVDFSTLNKDGIILFHPQNRDGTGDFVSLAVNDGYVEFRSALIKILFT